MDFIVSSLHYSVKTYSFVSKKYEELIDIIAPYSMGEKEQEHIDSEKYLNPFLDNFYGCNSINFSSNITIFGGDDITGKYSNKGNISQCKKSQFSLFYIKSSFDIVGLVGENICKKDSVYRKVVENKISIFIEEFNKYSSKAKSITKVKLLFEDDFVASISALEFDKLLFDKNVRDSFIGGKKFFKHLEEKMLKSKVLFPDLYRNFKECYKAYQSINKFLSIIELYYLRKENPGKAFVISFLLISKMGFAQIGFVSPYVLNVYPAKDVNKYLVNINNAIKVLRKRENQLSNIYKFIEDFHSFYSNNVCFTPNVYSYFNPLASEPLRKALYLNCLYDNNSSIGGKINKTLRCYSIEPKMVFDYISLSLAYEHSYHNKFLWDYLCKDKICRFTNNEKLVDHGSGETEHFYYDDNKFILSVINPLYVYDEHYDLSSALKVYAVSHQSKIYSLWKYLYICEALSFGSIGVISFKYFINYCTYNMELLNFKILRMYFFHKVLTVGADLLKVFNLYSFAAKNDSIAVSNIVFKSIKLDSLIESTNDLLDNGWKDGNIVTSQTYTRYSLFMSIGSLLVSLFSFGMISKVYVDGYYISANNSMNKPPLNPFLLIVDAFNTPKMWLVTCICFLPFILWIIISIIERYKIKHFTLAKEYETIHKKEKK